MADVSDRSCGSSGYLKGEEGKGSNLREREKEEKGDAVVIFAIRYADVAVASDATPSFLND